MDAPEVRLDPLAYFAGSRPYRWLFADSRARFSPAWAAMACSLPTVVFAMVALTEGMLLNDEPDLSLVHHLDLVADLLLHPRGTFLTLRVLSQTHRVPGALREQISALRSWS